MKHTLMSAGRVRPCFAGSVVAVANEAYPRCGLALRAQPAPLVIIMIGRADNNHWAVRLLDRTLLLRWHGATIANEVYPRRGLLGVFQN